MTGLSDISTLTFDCYGTLIDWESGILTALRPVLTSNDVQIDDEPLLELYAELEAREEESASFQFRKYRAVLENVVRQLGQRLGFDPTDQQAISVAGSLPDWPPFPDTVAALKELKKLYRLVIISNIDNDLFLGTNFRLEVEFDQVITAEQAGAYKPSENVFKFALDKIGIPKDEILHCAQSLYHDVVPAKALDLKTAWVNRRHGRQSFGATPPAEVKPDFEVRDMSSLAFLLCAGS